MNGCFVARNAGRRVPADMRDRPNGASGDPSCRRFALLSSVRRVTNSQLVAATVTASPLGWFSSFSMR
jgi:hypothetical protein